MHEIIDAATNIGPHAPQLADAGVKIAIRYYNNNNTPVHPSKCLTARELGQLHSEGLSVAVVFQQRGGAGGNINDLTATTGTRDGRRALQLATSLRQPQGSAIYFAVDWDFVTPGALDSIANYFANAKAAIGGAYKIGVYGSGFVGRHLRDLGHVDYIWLAGSLGWRGTRRMLEDGEWTLFQKYMSLTSAIGGFGYDGNILNPALESFGQFSATAPVPNTIGVGVHPLYEITARGGINLRAGPGEPYRIIQSYPYGMLVRVAGRNGEWLKVDLQGDGIIDGYMHEAFLSAVSGGIPLAMPSSRTPIDVARAELARGVTEVSGSGNNPRILMYHATTSGGSAPDATPWCSSFVNYCVEEAGLVGTNSKWARSWHESGWGRDMTADAQPGDVVVFRRTAPDVDGGHVAFYLSEDADSVECLGGNQGNKVSIRRFPKNGNLGGQRYRLLSIRRA